MIAYISDELCTLCLDVAHVFFCNGIVELSYPRTFVSRNESFMFLATFVPTSKNNMELSFPNIDYYYI